MKKTLLTIAMVLTLGLAANAQNTLDWEEERENYFGNSMALFDWNNFVETFDWVSKSSIMDRSTPDFLLPSSHGTGMDYEGPLGSGIAVLAGLGAAYAIAKRRKEE